MRPAKENGRKNRGLPEATKNPSVKQGQYKSGGDHDVDAEKAAAGKARRYYSAAEDNNGDWPPELNDYNSNVFVKLWRRSNGVTMVW